MPLPAKNLDPQCRGVRRRETHGKYKADPQVPATTADTAIDADIRPETLFNPVGEDNYGVGSVLSVTVYVKTGRIVLRPRYFDGFYEKFTKQLPEPDVVDASVDGGFVRLKWDMFFSLTAVWV